MLSNEPLLRQHAGPAPRSLETVSLGLRLFNYSFYKRGDTEDDGKNFGYCKWIVNRK